MKAKTDEKTGLVAEVHSGTYSAILCCQTENNYKQQHAIKPVNEHEPYHCFIFPSKGRNNLVD